MIAIMNIQGIRAKLFNANEDHSWKRRALCRGLGPEHFYPLDGSHDYTIRVEDAKKVCNGVVTGKPCPVRNDCLEYALENNEESGVWGGCSERERRRIKRRRRQAE